MIKSLTGPDPDLDVLKFCNFATAIALREETFSKDAISQFLCSGRAHNLQLNLDENNSRTFQEAIALVLLKYPLFLFIVIKHSSNLAEVLNVIIK